MVDKLRQRSTEHHKSGPRRQRECAGQTQHRENQAAHGGGVSLGVGTGDFRHQQAGQRPQHRKRKEQQRQRHPFQAAVLGHGLGAAAGAERQRVGNQAALGRLQGAGQQAAALDRPKNIVEFLAGVGVQRGTWAGRKFRRAGGKRQHDAAGNALADRVAQQHGGAAVPRAPLGQHPQPRHGNSHPHQLLDELRCDIGLHPPRSQKAPPHRSGHRHKRQAGGQNQQRGLGADIVQQVPCARPGQHGLRHHGCCAEAQCREAQPTQRLSHAAAPGQALGRQPRRRHVDARRGEGHKHHVQRQNQLVQAHALAAQVGCQHDPETHAQRPQHQPRPGEQRCVLQIGLAFAHTPPPSPADGYAGIGRGMPCAGHWHMVKWK